MPGSTPPNGGFKRILIKGGSGAGKSTLARALAERLGLPWVELDAHHHGPNWKAATSAELQERVRAVLDDERGWVVDGNFDSKIGSLVLDRADLVLWLDLPLHTKLRRLLQRSARRYFSRERLWNDNRETLKGLFVGSDSLFVWAVRTHILHRRTWPQKYASRGFVRLRTPAEVRRFVAGLCPGH